MATISMCWSMSAITSPSASMRSRTNGGRTASDGRPDRVAEDADAERAEALLPPGAVAAGLRARARVHAVDDDPAELVHDQVHRPRLPAQQGGSGLARVERDAQGAGEVVAGAERDQSEGALGELVPPVQRRDDRVQAAVPARDHDRATAGPVEHSVELAGVARDGDLDVGVLPEHAEGDVERLSWRPPPASTLVMSRRGSTVLEAP